MQAIPLVQAIPYTIYIIGIYLVLLLINERKISRKFAIFQFDLTCNRAWMQSLGGSLFMFGMPFGAVLLGDLADRIGRKKGIVVCLLILVLVEMIGAASVNFYMYLAMRFLSGASAIAAFQTTFIIG